MEKIDFKNYPDTNTPITAERLNQMQTNIDDAKLEKTAVSDIYSSSSTYAVGDYCIYENTLYKCTTAIATAEAFNLSKWTAVTVAEELENKLGINAGAKQVANYFTSRPTSANLESDGSGGLKVFQATGAMTEGKPANDAHIIHLDWDNTNKYDSQIAISNNGSNNQMWIRAGNGTEWSGWERLVKESDVMLQHHAFNSKTFNIPVNTSNGYTTILVWAGWEKHFLLAVTFSSSTVIGYDFIFNNTGYTVSNCSISNGNNISIEFSETVWGGIHIVNPNVKIINS